MGEIYSYEKWVATATIFVFLSMIIVLLSSIIFYRKELCSVKDKIMAIIFDKKM